MSESLFNPGFLGSGFLWWIGQIVDDSTWRENINPEKFEKVTDIPAWGYRYKVKIMGYHDQSEAAIKAEQLPWAQVMFPITAGGGAGGSRMTPALKQGMFVFGFFLDGQDRQSPVIMGVLGSNAKTKMERKTGSEEGGGKNYTPQSFHSKNAKEEPTTQKKLKDDDLAPKQGGNEAYNSPSSGNVSKESVDATNLYTTADEKKKNVLEEKHALACPDPNRGSDMKNIQTVTETLTEKLEQFKKAQSDADAAAGLPIVEANKNVTAEIDRASKEMSKYMKGIMGQVQQFATNDYNEKMQPMLNLAVPSFKNKLLEEQVAGLEGIACAFNGINGRLAGLLAGALIKAFQKKKKQSRVTPPPVGIGTPLGSTRANNGVLETFIPVINEQGVSHGNWRASEQLPPELNTPGSEILPPLPREGFYSPTPLCSSEELVGEVLGSVINDIMGAYDNAAGPVVNTVKESLGGDTTQGGSAGQGTVDNAINETNVLAALSSGDLVGSLSSTMAEQAGVNPGEIGPVTNSFNQGNYDSGMSSLLDLSGKNIPANAAAIAGALAAIKSGDLIGGFGAVSNILGVDSNLMQGVGGALSAITSGDTAALLSSVGGLASMYPSVLNSIVGKGSALAGANLGNLIGGGGALGGMNFDIASSLTFVQSITKIFECDPPPECSPNDVHTMQGGGTTADGASGANVAQKAAKTADTPSSQIKTNPKRYKKDNWVNTVTDEDREDIRNELEMF